MTPTCHSDDGALDGDATVEGSDWERWVEWSEHELTSSVLCGHIEFEVPVSI